MLYHDRIDMSEGYEKNNNCKKCIICHYWFFIHGFRDRDYVCNSCRDLTILSVNISDIAIITVKNVDYCCIIHKIIRLVYIKWLIVWTSISL